MRFPFNPHNDPTINSLVRLAGSEYIVEAAMSRVPDGDILKIINEIVRIKSKQPEREG